MCPAFKKMAKQRNRSAEDGVGNSDPQEAEILPDHLAWKASPGSLRTFFFITIILLGLSVIIIYFVGANSTNYSSKIQFRKPGFDRSRLAPRNREFTRHGAHGEIVVQDNPSGKFPHFSNGTDAKRKDECESKPNSFWEGGKCRCSPPFWGPGCDRETHSNQYKAIGKVKNVDLDFLKTKVDMDFISRHLVTHKQFTEGSQGCEHLCDENDRCKGYLYLERKGDLNGCYLLPEPPKASDLYFTTEEDSQVYLRKDRTGGRPLLNKTVVLSNGKLPYRYWLETRLSNSRVNMIQINFDVIYHLRFYPERVTTDAKTLLVFSNKKMTSSSAKDAVREYRKGKKLENFAFYSPELQSNCKNIIPISWASSYWVLALELADNAKEDTANDTSETDLSITKPSSSCPPCCLDETECFGDISSVSDCFPYADNSTITDSRDKFEIFDCTSSSHFSPPMSFSGSSRTEFQEYDTEPQYYDKFSNERQLKTKPLNDEDFSVIFNDD